MTIWEATTDQDVAVLALYRRHYSHRDYADGRDVWQCLGPGNKFTLRTPEGDAIFGWRKFIDDCIDERTGERQQGVNCAFFRNEGRQRSSECIRQADAIADALWPDPRHYTYVDPKRVKSGLPGACFLAAGWRYVRLWDAKRRRWRRARTRKRAVDFGTHDPGNQGRRVGQRFNCGAEAGRSASKAFRLSKRFLLP